MKSLLLSLAVLGMAQACGAAQSLSQWGVTWTFDRDYETGQFANGDNWVVGPVTIVGIDPPSVPVGGRTMNGSMINPTPRNYKNQGYDSSMPGCTYQASLNVAFNVDADNPLAVPAHSSLVSTISSAYNQPSGGSAGGVPLKRAVVLTVLPAPAPAGSFRPPYCGSNKEIRFNKSQLRYELLRNLTPAGGAPSIATFATYFQAPWIDHIGDWVARYHHPSSNMPDYGREMHTTIGVASLLLQCNYTREQKEPLLIRFVQAGIDFHGVIADGGITNWTDGAGHTIGRKWPILFAGLMLDDPAMTNIGAKSGNYLYEVEGYGPGNAPPDYVHFGEDDQTFYVSAFDVAITHSDKWNPDSRDAQRIPYEDSDLGLPEWGIMHTRNPEKSNKYLPTKYRNVSGPPFHATALAALMMDAKALWNHDAYFDYTDRYMAFTAPGGEFAGWWRSMNDWTERMWDTYRAKCGPIWPDGAWDDPNLPAIGDRTVVAGEPLTFSVACRSDLACSAIGLPRGAAFENGAFAWTPTRADIGAHVITFTAGNGVLEDSETVTVTVEKPRENIVLTLKNVKADLSPDGAGGYLLRVEIPLNAEVQDERIGQ